MKLKPCPFCGRKPDDIRDISGDRIACSCGASVWKAWRGRQNGDSDSSLRTCTIRAWNRRAHE